MVLLRGEEDVPQVRARDKDHRHRVEDGEVQHHGEAVHVEERHDGEDAVAGFDRCVPRLALVDVRDERSM